MGKARSIIFLIAMAGLLSCTEHVSKEQAIRSPNILFILADDLGYGDLSSYNPDSKIHTPNIDAIASNGMKFTNAHSAGTWCVPSRYGLLTGRFPFRNTRDYENSMIAPDRETLGKYLQKNGYSTACIGKWHQGILNEKHPTKGAPLQEGPTSRGFDYFFGIPASLDIPPYYYIENDSYVEYPTDSIGDRYNEGWSPIQGAFWRGGKIAPNFSHQTVLETLTGKVNDYLDAYVEKEDGDPFFMYFAMTAPHTPWLPEKAFEGKSGAGMYGDFVLQVDHYVGTVLKKLEALGLGDDTIVMFASDNGPVWFPNNVADYGHNSVGPLSGMKADVLEGGHRMPFLVRWPGHFLSGSESKAPVCFTDIFATIAEILQNPLASDTGEDSVSFYPHLIGEEPPKRAPIIHSNGGLNSIVHGEWKYIDGKGPGGFTDRIMGEFPGILPRDEHVGQLYHLASDIGERKNLYAENPEKVEELSGLLAEYMENTTRALEASVN